MQHLAMVLQRLQEAGIKLKPSRFHLFKTQVTFLKHVMTPEGVLTDHDNVKKIREWQALQGITEVQAIIGMGNC